MYYDITIIGGGVVGGMTARMLSRYNVSICILEKENDVAMGATKANSAIVHAGFDAKFGSLKARLNVKGSEMMEEICKSLSVSYIKNGSIVLGYNDEDKKTLEKLKENGLKNGVKELEIINKDKLKSLEENICDDAEYALYAKTGAIVCPYELTIAAVGNAMDNGAELKLNFMVSAISKKDDTFEITSDTGEQITTKVIINAAGLYSDKIAKLIGDDSFDIHPRRGEYLLFDTSCGNTVSHTVFTVPTKMGKGILVSPTVDGNLLLGPTAVDCTDKTDKSVTAEGISAVMEASKKITAKIDFRKVITSFCGLRAVGNTGDFIINMPIKGFINAAAIESPGLSASPAIAEYIKDIISDGIMELTEKKNYIETRKSYKGFYHLSDYEKSKVISKDPRFGNIICRCEHISEGEILHALRTNPKPRDLDGIKRRTRSQMGRCQGGFCSPFITSILAKKLNVLPEQVTKNGGESNILFGKTKEDNQNA